MVPCDTNVYGPETRRFFVHCEEYKLLKKIFFSLSSLLLSGKFIAWRGLIKPRNKFYQQNFFFFLFFNFLFPTVIIEWADISRNLLKRQRCAQMFGLEPPRTIDCGWGARSRFLLNRRARIGFFAE
jgi:hypothetical protein